MWEKIVAPAPMDAVIVPMIAAMTVGFSKIPVEDVVVGATVTVGTAVVWVVAGIWVTAAEYPPDG